MNYTKYIYKNDNRVWVEFKDNGLSLEFRDDLAPNTWRNSLFKPSELDKCYPPSHWMVLTSSGFDPNDLQLEIPNMDDYLNRPNGNTLPIGHHDHVWKQYQGLNETFEFCEVCDLKRNK